MDCFAALAMMESPAAIVARSLAGTRKNLFIIFVDGMFTTFIAPPFTKTAHAIKRMCGISCVVHAGHAD